MSKESIYGVELKAIKGYEGYYSVTPDGRIYSHFSQKILKTSNNWLGYEQIPLAVKGKNLKLVYVHRAVAEAYIENPENKKEVHHIDGNKANNHKDNLQWTTRSENIKQAYADELIPRFKGKSPNGVRIERRVYKEGTNKFYVARAGNV